MADPHAMEQFRGSRDQQRAVWIDGYKARLAGGELSEKDEIGRVSLPNEARAQGPEFANASISKLLVETSSRMARAMSCLRDGLTYHVLLHVLFHALLSKNPNRGCCAT